MRCGGAISHCCNDAPTAPIGQGSALHRLVQRSGGGGHDHRVSRLDRSAATIQDRVATPL
ncbi:hypothetical protein RB388 [Rhodopirellula baltica SH 1]|uniref:Uncharacterized protein n=1 Tax=Rhodopirellula baltica (strain DSM 10527 / NCIMB 13988 / SH1) TaxID=243090 RepID=Q7UYT7_RHOBA|nr:hypothetical protein RB388 [Rhodopirellula baltica SH 1]